LGFDPPLVFRRLGIEPAAPLLLRIYGRLLLGLHRRIVDGEFPDGDIAELGLQLCRFLFALLVSCFQGCDKFPLLLGDVALSVPERRTVKPLICSSLTKVLRVAPSVPDSTRMPFVFSQRSSC
jgi:hypothetical protein